VNATARRFACVIISNSIAPDIRLLIAGADERDSVLIVLPVMARRAINSSPGQRGPIAELLATNMRANRSKVAVRMLPATLRARTPERRRA
jgi:hypothetical protein